VFYKLNRLSGTHNALRVAMNTVLYKLPTGLKYAVGGKLRSLRHPYKLLRPGNVVVQLGAPWDLLQAGRSRAAHFAQLIGPDGRLVVVEPDPANVDALQGFIRACDLTHVEILPLGAWNEPGTLSFLYDPDHPAANALADVFDESRPDRDKFKELTVEVAPLDDILQDRVDAITLLSITTNGAEAEILAGATEVLKRCQYVSIINHRKYDATLTAAGFRLIAEDDRGATYARAG
jgi:FkbM family methyltransferase